MSDQYANNHAYQPQYYQAAQPQYQAPGFSPPGTMAAPHSFVSPTQSSTKSSSSTTSTPQVRKKRGRPPKATSLSSKITTTLNISVNTSPLSSSPTAESNSNQIVKRGAPDFFTPLMRIGNVKQKKKRKNSSSSSVGSSPSMAKKSKTAAAAAAARPPVDNVMVTPLSSAINGSTFTPYHQINTKALDNISMITQSDHAQNPHMFNLHNNDVSYYNTPPSSTVKGHFPNYLSTPQFGSSSRPSPTFPTPSRTEDRPQSQSQAAPAFMVTSSSPTPGVHIQDPMNLSPNSNLLPPVSLVPSKMDMLDQQHHPMPQHLHQQLEQPEPQPKQVLRESPTKQRSRGSSGGSSRGPSRSASRAPSLAPSPAKSPTPPASNVSFKLTIDDSGKAVFSSNFFASETKEEKVNPEVSPHTKPLAVPAKKGKAVAKTAKLKKEVAFNTSRPKLTHAKSVIGIEAQYVQQEHNPTSEIANPINSAPAVLRRHNSDITGFTNTVQNTSLSSINEHVNTSQLPQTPKYDDNYLYTSTGFTPTASLGFNLTPQFNSMMYSMMSINSPQVKKNNQDFLANQEFFMGGQSGQQPQEFRFDQDTQVIPEKAQQSETSGPSLNINEASFTDGSINMTDLMNLGNSTDDYDSKPATKSLQGTSSSSPSNEDSGDARLALKKIIHVKRK